MPVKNTRNFTTMVVVIIICTIITGAVCIPCTSNVFHDADTGADCR